MNMKTIRVVAAIIERNHDIFVARRSYGDFAGFWEFPGGKYEDGENGVQAIKREIKEEFDVEIDVGQFLCTVEHQYDNFYLIMDCFICSLRTDHLELHDHSEFKWISPYDSVSFLPADEKVIMKYREFIENERPVSDK